MWRRAEIILERGRRCRLMAAVYPFEGNGARLLDGSNERAQLDFEFLDNVRDSNRRGTYP
jgi:hypothetical protein